MLEVFGRKSEAAVVSVAFPIVQINAVKIIDQALVDLTTLYRETLTGVTCG